MLGYKKKLLDMNSSPAPLPVQPPKAPKENRNTFTPKRAEELTEKKVNELRTHLKKEFDLDSERLRKELAPKTGKGVFVALWLVIVFLVLCIGALAGALFWVYSRQTRNTDIEKQLSTVQNQLETQMSAGFSELFQNPKLQAMIDEKARLYTEENLNKSLNVEINKRIKPMSEEMENLAGKVQNQAQAALQNLDAVSSFMLLVTRAQNDDRRAFEELLAISRDRNHEYREVAKQATAQIFADVTAAASAGVVDYPMREKFRDFEMDQFQSSYHDAIPIYRPAIMQDMWNSRKFNKYQKINFLMAILYSETSLRALQKACALLDEEAMLYKPFTAYQVYLDWWKANEKRYFPAS